MFFFFIFCLKLYHSKKWRHDLFALSLSHSGWYITYIAISFYRLTVIRFSHSQIKPNNLQYLLTIKFQLKCHKFLIQTVTFILSSLTFIRSNCVIAVSLWLIRNIYRHLFPSFSVFTSLGHIVTKYQVRLWLSPHLLDIKIYILLFLRKLLYLVLFDWIKLIFSILLL